MIKFEEFLPTGEKAGTLKIKNFKGDLNDQMAGFYRSEFVNLKGEKEFLAVTQFEPIDARRCFPCVDEPGRKATFKVTMTVSSEKMQALSNMPEASVTIL